MRFLPNFKGYDFFPPTLRLPFMRFKGAALVASIVAMALSLAIFYVNGLNYGVDFKGGTLIEVQSKAGAGRYQPVTRQAGPMGIAACKSRALERQPTC